MSSQQQKKDSDDGIEGMLFFGSATKVAGGAGGKKQSLNSSIIPSITSPMTAADAIVTTPSASEMITMHYDDNDNNDSSSTAIEDRAEKAYESIAATLESWTSPKLRQQQQRSVVGSSLDNNNNEEWWNSNDFVFSSSSSNNKSDNKKTPSPAGGGAAATRTTTTPATTTTVSTPKKTTSATPSNVERAATPVMSNSSKKKIERKGTPDNDNTFSPMMMNLTTTTTPGKKLLLDPVKDLDCAMEDQQKEEQDDDPMVPVNVQSPWMKQQQQEKQQQPSPQQQHQLQSSKHHRGLQRFQQQQQQQQQNPKQHHYHWIGLQTTSPRAIAPFKNQSYEYRRYHDALLVYVKARKNLNDRIRLDQQDRQLLLETTTTNSNPTTNNNNNNDPDDSGTNIFPTFSGDRNLTEEETRIELDFLWALNSLCWERSDSEHHHLHHRTTTHHGSSSSSNNNKGGSNNNNINGGGGSNLYHHPHCSRREGDFWLLLCHLRRLGLPCLIWSDDDNSQQQNKFDIITYIQNQARNNIDAAPLQLYEELSSDHDNLTKTTTTATTTTTSTTTTTTSGCPLVLKRRKRILGWMEHCFEQLLPEPARNAILSKKENSGRTSRDTTYQYVAGLMTSKKNPPESSNIINDKLLMKSCLALILAGRLDDARQMARRCGQAWRAASWGGGTPSGTKQILNDEKQTLDNVQIGNVHRSLWKRQMYKLSDKLHQRLLVNQQQQQQQSQQQQQQDSLSTIQEGNGNEVTNAEAAADEAAIHALLANHYQNAMSNPSLRSWEKGLYSIYRSMWGRLEDELLYLHNKHRRDYRPPYPGTQYEKQELEQLHATDELLHMTESKVLELLALSPFDEISNDNSLCGAISAFLTGGLAVTEYLSEEHKYFGENTYIEDHQVAHLRFITHLVLYLDSLSVCTTPIVFDDAVIAFKNHVLYVYVHHLADHEDLRHMMPLYASLLPTGMLLKCFPKLLIQVDNNDERKQILQQIRDLITTSSTAATTTSTGEQQQQQEIPLDIIILRKVIRYILSEPDPSSNNDHINISNNSNTYNQSPAPALPMGQQQQQQELITAEETTTTTAITTTTIVDTSGIGSNSNNNTPSQADLRKMKSINWLCFHEEHLGDALIASNSLLRQFLLSNKIQSAILLVQDFLPDEIPEKAVTGTTATADDDSAKESSMLSSIDMDIDSTNDAARDDDADADNNKNNAIVSKSNNNKYYNNYYNNPRQQLRVDYARSEHIAYQSYLNAFRAVELWSEILTGTPASFESMDNKLVMDAFNELESSIASTMERRDLIREKRKASQIIIENADVAKRDLMAVLSHPGGWLLTDDEEEQDGKLDDQMMLDDNNDDDDEEKEDQRRRKEEIRALRSRFLPHIVTMYHRVCMETSEWMSKSLDDAIPDLGNTSLEVLEQLDDFTGMDDIDDDEDYNQKSLSSSSPLSPKYWIKEALDLVDCIVTDTYGIRQAYTLEQLKELFLRMSDMKLTELMYSV